MTAMLRPSTGKVVLIGLGCWVITVGLVTVVPLVEPGPELGIGIATDSWWLLVGALTVQAVTLLWSEKRCRSALLFVSTVPVALAVISPNALFSFTAVPVMTSVYIAVARTPLRSLRVVLPTVAVVTLIADGVNRAAESSLGAGAAAAQSAAQAVIVIGLPLLVGSVVASRRDATAAHANELRALERERHALVRAAVAGERTAMARELHDIAAHHLSGIALMAAATKRQVGTDPDAARDSADSIRDQARSVLDDLRRLVGLLRDDAPSSERHVETIDGIADLVRSRRSAGVEIELRTVSAGNAESPGSGVGPLAQLVAYRMVQESLANAVRHAPGATCAVELGGSDEEFTVTVTNDKPPRAPVSDSETGGFGLVGMRERAALVGARLSCGPTDGGGWFVTMNLPREQSVSSGPVHS